MEMCIWNNYGKVKIETIITPLLYFMWNYLIEKYLEIPYGVANNDELEIILKMDSHKKTRTYIYTWSYILTLKDMSAVKRLETLYLTIDYF